MKYEQSLEALKNEDYVASQDNVPCFVVACDQKEIKLFVSHLNCLRQEALFGKLARRSSLVARSLRAQADLQKNWRSSNHQRRWFWFS